MTRRQRVLVALAALFAVVLVAGVVVAIVRRGSAGTVGAIESSTAPATAASPTPPTPSATASMLSPLTGKPVAGDQPVLAVKIDNVRPARPQTGLGQADVVYLEPVEGGLSRIMAIFSSSLPPRVGPVRSARQSDLELLAEYGRPGLAFSGANATVLKAVAKAPVADLSQDSVPAGYRRSSSRPAPHNLFADPRLLLQRGDRDHRISAAKDVGFQFGPLPAGIGTATTHRTVRYGAAVTTFTWSAKRRLWNVTLDGSPDVTTDGGPLGAATVVLQDTRITSSGLHDVLGNTTPYTHSIGSGKATVLRDGVAIPARWSRSSADSGTTYTTSSGAPLPFAAGQVWVVFVKS